MLDKNKLRKKALTCYQNQRRRCYYKNNPRYKDNGDKGIKVLYSREEFIEWYINNYKAFINDVSSVGRIDHSKSYSFDNIRFESRKENSLERIDRLGPTRKKVKVVAIDYKTNEKLMIFNSIKQATKLTGVNHIGKYINKKLVKSNEGFTFELHK